MARKSRKNLPEKEIVVKPVVLTQEQEQLPTGAYIRLSALNNGYKDADSISMQIKLVESFIMSHEELKLVETYVDNGYTGTEFDRPEFVRMMEDVKSGKIRCVVGGKTKVMTVGSKSVRKRPENEWIVTENAHPAIVNHEEFYCANDIIQKTGKPDFKLSYDYPLRGKVRCGNCRRMLHYEANGYEATLYCGNSRQSGKHSQCCKATYSVRRIDTVVMKYLDRMFGILEWVSDQTEIYYPTDAADSLAAQISKLERDIEILKAEKLRQYESYAEGIISKEEYIRKKERIAEKVKAAEQTIAEKGCTLQGDRAVIQSVEALMETSSQFEEEPRLTQELSDIYVDTVYVYDTERVEVVLNNEDVIRGIIDRIQSKAGKR